MSKDDGLVGGGKLEIEDLDLTGIGMYTQEQKDKLLEDGVPEEDFFIQTIMSTSMWARKSDESKKWYIYRQSDLKLGKDLVKKKR